MYIYIYIYIYIYMYIICVHLRAALIAIDRSAWSKEFRLGTRTHTHYIYVYMYVYLRIHAYMHTCIHTNTHKQSSCAHTNRFIFTHIHTRRPKNWSANMLSRRNRKDTLGLCLEQSSELTECSKPPEIPKLVTYEESAYWVHTYACSCTYFAHGLRMCFQNWRA